MKLRDLDLVAGSAKVWDGKGGKDGIVPLSPPAIAALREYMGTVRPNLAGKSGDPPSYRVSSTRRAAMFRH